MDIHQFLRSLAHGLCYGPWALMRTIVNDRTVINTHGRNGHNAL